MKEEREIKVRSSWELLPAIQEDGTQGWADEKRVQLSQPRDEEKKRCMLKVMVKVGINLTYKLGNQIAYGRRAASWVVQRKKDQFTWSKFIELLVNVNAYVVACQNMFVLVGGTCLQAWNLIASNLGILA